MTGAFFLALGISAGAATIGSGIADAFDGDGSIIAAEDGDDSMQCVDIYTDPPYVGVSVDHCFPPPA